ncbi:sodium nucleoside cotransporter [Diplodia corticola]|uniref:Sodium nucleoside cotransporter n=1 Tax=Diplodia corticola TaxID=236234 RepID=A0A1J9R8Q5_9PEZI|nr:sodium nucleoside cotransporter [Diplodia corticola]OJD28787.1 sodium nucleoside cotransporter [Diplodia corticola]
MVQPTANSSGAAGDISVREWICWVGTFHAVHRLQCFLRPPLVSLKPPPSVASHSNRRLTSRAHAQEGEAPVEPTSTLVLTAPSNTFLDTRLLLPTPFTPTAERPLPNTGGPLDRLEWAFSGVSETLPPIVMSQTQHVAAHSHAPPLASVDYRRLCDFSSSGGGTVTVPRKRWNHVIDSKCVAPGQKPAPDEGEMYAVAGRPEACLEIGKMEREKGSGVVSRYQELWVSAEPRLVGSETRRQGVVLSLDMPEQQARGIIIRVAQYCQALLITKDQIDLERWECVDGTRAEWQRAAKLGSRFLPCSWTFEGGQAIEEGVAVGSTLQDGEMKWQVQERFAWDGKASLGGFGGPKSERKDPRNWEALFLIPVQFENGGHQTIHG